MIQIRVRDIDPDTGGISQDFVLCTTQSKDWAEWIKLALARENADIGDPNREFYIVNPEDPNRELNYEERIAWFVSNYYETGMEFQSLLQSMKTENLDKFEWCGETIRIPKTYSELGNASV